MESEHNDNFRYILINGKFLMVKKVKASRPEEGNSDLKGKMESSSSKCEEARNEEQMRREDNCDGSLDVQEIEPRNNKNVHGKALERLMVEDELDEPSEVISPISAVEMNYVSSQITSAEPIDTLDRESQTVHFDSSAVEMGLGMTDPKVDSSRDFDHQLADAEFSGGRRKERLADHSVDVVSSGKKPPLIDLEVSRGNRPPVIDLETNNVQLVDLSGENSPFIDIEKISSSDTESAVFDLETVCYSDSSSSVLEVETLGLEETECPAVDIDIFDFKKKGKPVAHVESSIVRGTNNSPTEAELTGESSFSTQGIMKGTIAGEHHSVKQGVVDVSLDEISNQCPLCFQARSSDRHMLWHFFAKNADGVIQDYAVDFIDLRCKAEGMSYGNLLEFLKEKIPGTDGLYCMQCRENFEVHFDPSKLVKLIAVSTKPTCIECNKTFCDRGSLKIHVRKHLGPKPYGCCCCKEVFDDAADVKLHMNVHTFHSYGKHFPCNICSRISFSEVDHADHVLEHAKFSVVKRNNINVSERENEETEHTQNHESPVLEHNQELLPTQNSKRSSQICFSESDSENDAREYAINCDGHISNRARRPVSVDDITTVAKVNAAMDVDRFFYSEFPSNLECKGKLPHCQSAVELLEEISRYGKREGYVCSEKGLLNGELGALESIIQSINQAVELTKFLKENRCRQNSPQDAVHSIEDMNDQLVVFKKVLSSSYGSILEKLDQTKMWCNFCGSSFSDHDELRVHKDEYHETPNVFSCEKCAASFGAVNSLIQHRTMHVPNRLHCCPVCYKEFDFRFDKTQHLKIHFADKLKRCPECGHHYKLQSQLTDHLETHLEMKAFLYKCKECPKVFSGFVPLNKHIQRAHEVKRPHECSVCGKMFSRQNSWLLHVRGHVRNKFRKSLIGMDMYKPRKRLQKTVL